MASYDWITSFSTKEFQAPFYIKSDSEYYKNLRKRLTHFVSALENANADKESIYYAKKYSDKICEALRKYYKGCISSCHQIVENLVKGCESCSFAVSDLNHSSAFPGLKNSEIQFFRARKITEATSLEMKDMLHLPFSLRGKSGNYRFSIPGVTSMYLANTSYGSWIEMGKPSEHDFYVSPIVLDGNLKVFNLAVMTRSLYGLNDCDPEHVHCWIKLLVLMIATSYNIEEDNRSFQSEYIIPQSIMLACKKRGYDGIAYLSKRVEEDVFAYVATNLALFADYQKDKEFGEICKHLIIDEPLNYQLFKQLDQSTTIQKYDKMRIDNIGYVTNINGYKRQYNYKNTDFYRFDNHLFARWEDKEVLDWGNALDDSKYE